MSFENKDRPAFPISEETTDRIEQGVTIYTGITKREYFAGLAMQGLLANESIRSIISGNNGMQVPDLIAEYSLQYADELLKQL